MMPPSFQSESKDGPIRVWLTARDALSLGESWIPSSTEWPNEGEECLRLLSEVLEDGPRLTRYSLSSKACRGILRRAEKRGKDLPPMLEQALKQVAGPK